LLLNLNADRGQKVARDVYEKDPKNPAYASTYAFALHVQGDTKKALQVFETLTPEQLHQPEIAAYYGIMLAATGDPRAGEFLEAQGYGVAIYHSHPRSAPEPSQTDINLAAYPGWPQLIVSLENDEPLVRAWRIENGNVSEEELEIRD